MMQGGPSDPTQDLSSKTTTSSKFQQSVELVYQSLSSIECAFEKLERNLKPVLGNNDIPSPEVIDKQPEPISDFEHFVMSVQNRIRDLREKIESDNERLTI
jgi:hypothetical protein